MNQRRAVHELGLLAALGLAILPVQAGPARPEAYPDPPQVLFKDLFVAVQMQAIFPDGKAFADATPTEAPGDILAQYHAAYLHSPQALRRFVEAHFSLPGQAVSAASATLPYATVPPASGQEGIVTHIDALWDPLTRRTPTAARYSPMLPLPQPLCGSGRPLSGAVLLGFLFHDARPGGERAS